MSGTYVAYMKGYNAAMAGEAFCNPYPHFTFADNADRYSEGFRNGSRLSLVNGLSANTTWKQPEPIPYKAGMSKDRVVFRLADYYFRTSPAYAKIVPVLQQVFGVTGEDIQRMRAYGNADKSIRIVCRPSQFARFVIRRHEAGLQNMFKELEAKLYNPDQGEYAWDVDVSRNKPW